MKELKELDLHKCMSSAEAVTKICYHESTRNLNYRIGCYDLMDLERCVEVIEGYNGFLWKVVVEALRVSFSDKDSFGTDLASFEIGREGSPVIYVKWWKREGSNKASKKLLKNFGALSFADEISIKDDGPYLIGRFWWD